MAGIIKDGQVYAGCVTDDHINEVIKSNIATTIDKNSTDDEVASAKSVNSFVLSRVVPIIEQYDWGQNFENTKYGINQDNTATEIIRAIGQYYKDNYGDSSLLVVTFTTSNNTSMFNKSLPCNGRASITTVKFVPWQLTTRNQIICSDLINSDLFVGGFNSSSTGDIVWKRVCTTSVADVPRTIITDKLASTKVSFTNSDSYVSYYVKNGSCYVTIWSMKILEACSVEVIFEALPKSAVGVTSPLCNGKESFAQIFISPNSSNIAVNASADLVGKNGYCSFSYPVAES